MVHVKFRQTVVSLSPTSGHIGNPMMPFAIAICLAKVPHLPVTCTVLILWLLGVGLGVAYVRCSPLGIVS